MELLTLMPKSGIVFDDVASRLNVVAWRAVQSAFLKEKHSRLSDFNWALSAVTADP